MTFLPFAGILVCAVFFVGMARKHWKWMGIVVAAEIAIALLSITTWDETIWEVLFFGTSIWEDSALCWTLIATTVDERLYAELEGQIPDLFPLQLQNNKPF